MGYIMLFINFFKIGLFTIGGGLATLPLLQAEIVDKGLILSSEFADMVAISQSTPGPIGVNLATYIGYSQKGIVGAIIATLGLVAPSIIIICIIAKWFFHFNEKAIVKDVFKFLRPGVIGIILSSAYLIATFSIFDLDAFWQTKNFIDLFRIEAVLLFIGMFILIKKYKWHPAIYILISGILGIIFF